MSVTSVTDKRTTRNTRNAPRPSDMEAKIRPYNKEDDDKLVRFMIGKAHMEPLAAANRQACWHPLSLAVWFCISSISTQVLGMWPKSEYGVFGYLSPLPAFAASALPVMFLIDWLNRPFFETDTGKALARADVVDTKSYYSRSPASGFWLLDFGTKFVGLIAVDASPDSLSEETVTSRSAQQPLSKGTSAVATIRHIFVNESYRPASMQSDLLAYAVDHAFNQSGVEKIRATTSSLTPYVRDALRDAGFRVVEKRKKSMGLLGWRSLVYELTRQQWTARKED